MPDELTIATFADLLGDTFEVQVEGADPIDLELVDARGVAGDSDTREPFSILFLGPGEPVLDQQTVALQHPGLGIVHLFLVPLGPHPEREGMRYEAVFS